MAFRGYDPDEEARIRDVAAESLQQTRFPSYPEYNPQAPAASQEEAASQSRSSAPAPLTDIPTSSTNSARPRTVAAGYQRYFDDPSLGKMTVLFRDGTLYNYYDVTPGEWSNFSASISKGAPWLNRGFPDGKQQVDGLFISKPRGLADISGVSESARSAIYKIARTAQVRFKNPRRTRIDMGNGRVETFSGSVPKAVKRKAQLSPRSGLSKSLGKNPSKNAGKNPYK